MNISRALDYFLDRPGISKQTRQKYYYRLREYCSIMGASNTHLEDVTTSSLLDYINSQPQLNDVSKSILRQSFHAFFSYWRKQGYLDVNPASSLPRWRDTPRRIHVPNESEVVRALETAVTMCQSDSLIDMRDGLIFSLAVYSGCRRDELRNLDMGEIDEAIRNPSMGEDGNVTHTAYTRGKTGEAMMRFSEFHADIFLRYLAKRPKSRSKAVFVNLNSYIPNSVKNSA